MWAIALKELRQLSRDRRTLAMLFLPPLLLLIGGRTAVTVDDDHREQTAEAAHRAGRAERRL